MQTLTPGLAVLALLISPGCGADEPERAPAGERSADAPRTPPADGSRREHWQLGKGESRTIAIRDDKPVELHDRPGGQIIERVNAHTEFGSRRIFWVAERRGAAGGWLGVPSPVQISDDLVWIRLDHNRMRLATTPYMIRGSLAERRIELLRRGRPIFRATVDIGSTQTPTPTGRFAVTDTIRRGLHPSYGCCAIALSARQPDVPAGWTGGDRIAIHGMPGGATGDADSNGCLRATNADMDDLMRHVGPGVPVIVDA